MDNLPHQMYQSIGDFLPLHDLRSMRLVNRRASAILERNVRLRMSAFKTITDTSLRGLQRLMAENQIRVSAENRRKRKEYITTLVLDEAELGRSLRNTTGGDNLVVQALAAIFRDLSNLTTIIWKVDRRKEQRQPPGLLVAYAGTADRPLRVFASAIQGLRLKIHMAGREFEFTVYWEGSKSDTNIIRLIGGGPPGRLMLAPLDQASQDIMSVAYSDIANHLCSQIEAFHVSCLYIEQRPEIMRTAFNDSKRMVIDNCILTEDIEYPKIQLKKRSFTLKNSYIDFDILIELLANFAVKVWTEHLQSLYIQGLHNIYFEWPDGVIDAGAHLQDYIQSVGLRTAAQIMRHSARRWRRDDVYGYRYQHPQPLRRVWNMDDVRDRQVGHTIEDQNFRAYDRR